MREHATDREWRMGRPLAIRQGLHMSQSEFARFAHMIDVSVATLQNWEQGRRRPEGSARALLKIAAENPKAVSAALAR